MVFFCLHYSNCFKWFRQSFYDGNHPIQELKTCANPLPTFCQPFANLFCQPLSKPLLPWVPGTRLETRVDGFLVPRLLTNSCSSSFQVHVQFILESPHPPEPRKPQTFSKKVFPGSWPCQKSVEKSPGTDFNTFFCEPSGPLQHSKMPRTPNLSKMCPDDRFSGFQSFVNNLSKISRKIDNLSGNYVFFFPFHFFDKFLAIWAPLIGSPKNNRRDNFLTNLGFGAFLNAVRGRRVRKPFWGPLGLSRHFLTLRGGRPGKTFLRLCGGFRAQKGLETLACGRSNRKKRGVIP